MQGGMKGKGTQRRLAGALLAGLSVSGIVAGAPALAQDAVAAINRGNGAVQHIRAVAVGRVDALRPAGRASGFGQRGSGARTFRPGRFPGG